MAAFWDFCPKIPKEKRENYKNNIFSATCQLFVVFPAVFDYFSDDFLKKTTVWDIRFSKF